MSESKREFGGSVRARKAAAGKGGGSGKGSGSGKGAGGKGSSKQAEGQEQQLVPLHAFGSVGGDIRDPVGFLSDSTSVCHLVGQYLAIYNTDKRSMAFFTKNKSCKGVLGMCVAPNWKVVALCERNGLDDKAQVSVYHVTTQRKMRTLTYPMRGEFTMAAFSSDAKILATYGTGASSDSESHIVYWKWAVEKVMCVGKGNYRATRLRINPDDASQLTTSGPQHLRLWRATMDPVLKESTLVPGKREQDNFVDHAWLRDGRTDSDGAGTRLIAVTDGGALLVFDKTLSDDGTTVYEIKHQLQCQFPDPSPTIPPVRIESLVASNKGFCVGGTRGFFAVYEKTEDEKDPFLMFKTFTVGDSSISSMSISPNEEHLVAYSRPNRLQMFPLSNIDILTEAKSHFVPMSPQGVHLESVIGLDVCVQMPLVVTASSDRSVRVWDYLIWHCQVAHTLDEVPQTVAFHPSGLLILVGFRERLRAYNLLMDGLKLFQPNQKDLQVKNCRAISFAHGGQFFACGAGIKVLVYATYTFDEVASFEGHVSVPIRQLTWSQDDRLLCSCGDDGAVYTCSMDDHHRLEDLSFVHKQTQYTSVAINKDHTIVIGAGADGFLRLTSATGEEETYATGDSTITQLLLDKDNTKLYAGTTNGAVRVYDWPFPNSRAAAFGKPMPGGGGGAAPTADAGAAGGAGAGAGAGSGSPVVNTGTPIAPTFVEFPIHDGPIASIRLSRDGKYLFTASGDGCVFAMAIPSAPSPEGEVATPARGKRRTKAAKRSQPLFEPADKRQFNLGVALVNQEVMEEKLADLAAMEKKLEETKSTAKYNLSLNDSEWQEKLAKQAEARDEQMQAEKKRYDELQQVHEAYVRDHMEEKERTDAEHVRVVQEVENQYEHKLALELERYDALSEQVESMRQECEILLDSAEQAHAAALKDREQQFAEREAELKRQLEALHSNLETNQKKFQTILAGVEEEHEQEITARKKRERKAIAEVEKHIANKQKALTYEQSKNDQLRKTVTELTNTTTALESKLDEAEARNRRLDELLNHADRVIEEQKKSIADKEKQILNLRAGNRTLDNFRFVLDHRINQLTQERGPITAHVDELEKHIREMYDELVREFHEKKATDREMSNKDLKIEGLTRESVKLRAAVREKERVIASIQADLERHVKTTEIKDLEGALKDMYRTYVKHERPGTRMRSTTSRSSGHSEGKGGGKDGEEGAPAVNSVQASEAVQEVLRQKEYMERHAKGLKRKLHTRMMQTKAASRARLAENATLINECNQLRKDNMRFQRKIKELETTVYLLTRDNGGPPDMGPKTTGRVDTMGMRGSFSASGAGAGGMREESTLSSVPDTGAAGHGDRSRISLASAPQRSRPRSRPAPAARSDDPGNSAIMDLARSQGKRTMARSRSDGGLRSAGPRGASRGSSGSGRGGYGLWASGGGAGGSRPGSRGGLNASSSGRIVRGTTKQLDELSTVRVKMSELLAQLDDNNREMSMQRREIKRLRDQVRLLATSQQSRPPMPPGGVGGLAMLPPAHHGHSGAGFGSRGLLPPTNPSMSVTGLPVSPVQSPRELAPLGRPGLDVGDAGGGSADGSGGGGGGGGGMRLPVDMTDAPPAVDDPSLPDGGVDADAKDNGDGARAGGHGAAGPSL